MTDWKPIAEAPKNRSILGAWYDHEFTYMEMYWNNKEWISVYGNYWCEPIIFILIDEPK